MRTCDIERFEIDVQKYHVGAANESKAIAKRSDGPGEPVDGGVEYVAIADDYGLRADEHLFLAGQLRA